MSYSSKKLFLLLEYPSSFQLRTDRSYQNDPCRPSGGTAIVVHRRIAHRQLPPPVTSCIELKVVALCVGAREVRLISAYLPPGRDGPPRPEEWNALLDHSLPTIAAGNFNSKYPTWNSRVTNLLGRLLYTCLLYTSRCV